MGVDEAGVPVSLVGGPDEVDVWFPDVAEEEARWLLLNLPKPPRAPSTMERITTVPTIIRSPMILMDLFLYQGSGLDFSGFDPWPPSSIGIG